MTHARCIHDPDLDKYPSRSIDPIPVKITTLRP